MDCCRILSSLSLTALREVIFVVCVKVCADKDILTRTGTVRAAFLVLKNLFASRELSMRTKLCIFTSSLIRCGNMEETPRRHQHKNQVFVADRCVRRVLRICWKDGVRNEDFWEFITGSWTPKTGCSGKNTDCV